MTQYNIIQYDARIQKYNIILHNMTHHEFWNVIFYQTFKVSDTVKCVHCANDNYCPDA